MKTQPGSLALWAALALLGCNASSSVTAKSTPTGKNPHFAALADLDNDSKLDVVVANNGDGTIEVQLGKGDGSFAAPVRYKAGSGPMAVAAGDLDGDGWVDLASANWFADSVSVFRNLGYGSFAAAQVFTVIFSAGEPAKARVRTFAAVELWALTAGDFNRDGAPDIAFVAASANPNVAVYLNDGAGSFALYQTYPVADHGWHIATGDVNADGILDLAVANNGSDTISLLQGHGDGEFSLVDNLVTGRSPTSVALGDLDGDGKDDLVAANYQADSLSVLLSR